MSEKSSEYHKKTCIICGCHTNQTINIYEPRSGPNIVRLIQARFKFQPLNEDKYLCYSCNNWLINWHSLQALNSNDADNPSGTFRSSPMNNIMLEKDSLSHTKCTKPIAQVRPQLRNQPVQNISSSPKRNGYYLSRRTFLRWHRIKKNRRKTLHRCFVCGRSIVRKDSDGQLNSKECTVKCRNCREILQCRSIYLKSPTQQKDEVPKTNLSNQNLVNEECMVTSYNLTTSNSPHQHQSHQRPLIDGKVVSMLRRLGTTLSRENTSSNYQPPIMSPTKKTLQRWTRELAENDILINFNTAITEALPVKYVRRKLAYQITNVDSTVDAIEISSCSEEEDDITEHMSKKTYYEINLHHVHDLVPKGLSVTLIPHSKQILVK